MKKMYTLVAGTFIVLLCHAQMLTPTVIAAAGGFSNFTGGTLSYTVAEMTMVQTFSAGNHFLTQGFQQPNDNLTGLLDLTKDEFGAFAVYPNPAVDNVWYGFELPESGKVSFALYNDIGQKIADLYTANYTNGKITQQTNVSKFASGVYFLSMTFTSDKDGKVHSASKKFQVIN